jgi:hypothetical protein
VKRKPPRAKIEAVARDMLLAVPGMLPPKPAAIRRIADALERLVQADRKRTRD